MDAAPAIQATDQPEDTPAGKARRWIAEIKLAEKERNTWYKRGKRIVDRYADVRAAMQGGTDGVVGGGMRYNILWSNIQTLKPAIYAKVPKPIVERRYLDQDKTGRIASMVLQRSLTPNLETGGFDNAMSKSVDDYLLPGQGTMWVRYEPHFGESEYTEDVEIDENTEAPPKSLVWEAVCFDYVHWRDFLTNPARTWAEVRWVAKRLYLDKTQATEQFGKELADKLNYDHKPEFADDKDAGFKPEYEQFRKAIVYEIWDKLTRTVVWICCGYGDQPLKEADDPLGLRDFFPCPEPLLATTTTDSTIPIPDYYEYQDQARELDDLTDRLNQLVKACKIAGGYDARFPEIARIFEEGLENQLIPVESWAEFASANGLQGALSLVDLKPIYETLKALYEARAQVKADLYEITGISDIVRGQATSGNATATEQRIKGQFANLRLQDRQKAVARYARDAIRIAAEIISEHFSPETLMTSSSYMETETFDTPVQVPPPPPEVQQSPELMQMYQAQAEQMQQQAKMADFQAAIELLRSEKNRGFRIDIETDSTIEPDAQAEKQSRVEFLSAVGGFMESALGMSQQVPQLAPLMATFLLWGVRGFRVGRDLESKLEQAVSQLEAAQQQGQGQKPPSPEEVKAQMEQEKGQIEIAKAKIDQQTQQQGAEFETQRMQLDHQNTMQQMAGEAQLKLLEMQVKRMELEAKYQELIAAKMPEKEDA